MQICDNIYGKIKAAYHWIKIYSWLGYGGAAIAMIQVGEYLFAVVFWIFASIVITVKLWNALLDKPRLSKIFLCLIAFCSLLAVSMFWTYREKGNNSWSKFIQPQTTSPPIAAKIYRVFIKENTKDLDDSTNLLLTVTVMNSGPPTIAAWDGIDIVTLNGHTFHEIQHQMPDQMYIPFEDGNKMTILGKDSLSIKTTAKPIPTGGIESGFLFYEFTDLHGADIAQPGVKIILSYQDVTGKDYKTEYVWVEANGRERGLPSMPPGLDIH
jgi:hypothetical protein